jgi:membrane protein YqaA with SNARE-associated domain
MLKTAIAAWGAPGLLFCGVLEAMIPFLPPDFVLIALCLADPARIPWYVAAATAGSTIGAAIANLMGRRFGRPLILKFVSEQKLEKAVAMFGRHNVWAIALGGFTPLPFFLFTLTSGVCRIRLKTVVPVAMAARLARYSLEGVVLWKYGETAREFLRSPQFGLLTLLAGALMILIVFGALKLRERRKRGAKSALAAEKEADGGKA